MTDKRRNDRSENDLQALREALNVYLSGQSGIRFESLAQFAGPLFDLYELDWRALDSAPGARDRDEIATMVAVLDTARLLWSFFSLDEEKSLQMLPELEDALLGRHARDEERSNVLVLLSLLEEHWHQFSPAARASAEDTPGFTLPSFETLIAEYNDRLRSTIVEDDDRFGPEKLDLPEAIALFAQPLLEEHAAGNDPDVLESRVARAQAYWELANAPAERYEHELTRILDAFAGNASERKAIRAEARRMVIRYRDLFSERPGRKT